MLKALLISASSIVVTLGAVFLYFQIGQGNPDGKQQANLPQIFEAETSKAMQDVLAGVEEQPSVSQNQALMHHSSNAEADDADILRKDTSIVLASLAGTANTTAQAATNPVIADDNTPRDLQILIARVLAESNNTTYVDDINTEATAPQKVASNKDVMFENTVISNSATNSTLTDQVFNSNDSSYIAQLNGASAPPKRLSQAVKYKVKSGDSLAKISFIHYGRTSDYVVIFQANRDQIKNPDRIMIGQSLTVPAL